MKIFLTFLVLSTLCASSAFAAKYYPVMYAEAEAIIKVQPDSAVLNCGIVSKGSDVLELKKKTSETVAQILQYCKNSGISEKSISIEFLTIEPISLEAAKKENTYNVEQSMSIQIEDMTKYETILTDILGLGINQIKNVNLQVKDIDKYKAQVRELAVKKAKDKVAALVELAGLKIVSMSSISETNQRYMPSMKSNDNPSIYTDVYIDNAESTTYGSIIIRSNIVVSYEVK